jgi:uncharacterized protein (TIGR04255 family)
MIIAKKVSPVMPFPGTERAIYETNLLDEVICQVRFTPILKIDTDQPSAFQDAIRTKYPFYKSKHSIGLPPGFQGLVPKDFPAMAAVTIHEFGSKDEKCTLALTRDFLGLTSKSYTCWEDFRAHMVVSLSALQRSYSPYSFVRVGLRYRNVIRRSRIGLGRYDWSELLRPWIAGAYSSADMRGEIESNSIQMLMRLPDFGGHALVSSGVVKDTATNEECYLIDGDFFIDQPTEPSYVLERLNFLNKQSHRFFHWCISERLHDALLAGADSVP